MTDDTNTDTDTGEIRERMPEEKLKALSDGTTSDEEIRTLAKRALQRRQEGRL